MVRPGRSEVDSPESALATTCILPPVTTSGGVTRLSGPGPRRSPIPRADPPKTAPVQSAEAAVLDGRHGSTMRCTRPAGGAADVRLLRLAWVESPAGLGRQFPGVAAVGVVEPEEVSACGVDDEPELFSVRFAEGQPVVAATWGQAAVANAATQILLRQAPQAIDAITQAFHLTDGERHFLLSAERGQGLLAAGTQRVSFHALASDPEHDLVTTDPEFLAKLEAEERNSGVDAP